MRNILYEIKKILSNKIAMYLFMIGILVNGFVIINKPDTIRNFYNYRKEYIELYDRLEGKVTDEKVRYVQEKYNELNAKNITRSFSYEYDESLLTGYEISDYELFREMNEKYKYIQDFDNSMEKINTISKENIEYYEQTDNPELIDYNKKISNTYSSRHINNFYETKYWKYYLNYAFSNLCILLVTILACKGVFSGERESKMETLIVTSRYGKRKTFISKIIASIIVTIVISITFIVEDFVLFTHVFNLKGMSEPIYSVEEMKYCMMDVSIIKYIFILNMYKIIGMICISGIVLLASALAGSNLLSIVSSVLFILPFIVFNDRDIACNVIRLLQVNGDLMCMKSKFFMGRSFIYVYFCLFTSLIILGIIWLVIFIIENYYNHLFGRERV